jgi:hypothetical protein
VLRSLPIHLDKLCDLELVVLSKHRRDGIHWGYIPKFGAISNCGGSAFNVKMIVTSFHNSASRSLVNECHSLASSFNHYRTTFSLHRSSTYRPLCRPAALLTQPRYLIFSSTRLCSLETVLADLTAIPRAQERVERRAHAGVVHCLYRLPSRPGGQ